MDTLPANQSKSSSNGSPCRREASRDSLVYLTTCMIGHLVEVHLRNGSVYSGIFHAADVEKDFGIVLKMASLIKDRHKSISEFFRKPPFKTFTIPADELVQVVAENLSVSSDGMFGVKSTFDEKQYTTTLPRSTQTRELEEKAQTIATEIEDESIRDVHVAEERGLQLNEKSDIDEETKYSAVRRVDEFDDSGFNEDGKLLDTWNDQTFGGSSTSSVQKSASSSVQKPASSSGKGYEDVPGDSQPSRNNTNVDQSCSISGDDARHLHSEQRSKDFPAPGSSISESQLGERRKNNSPEVSHSSRSAGKSVSDHGDIKEGAKIGGGGTSASKTVAERERQGSQVSGKTKSESSFGQSDSRSSESRPSPSTPSRSGAPPISSIGSLSSSEKFTFDPDVQEFKPFQPPAAEQTQSPTAYTSFYCPTPIPQMPVQAQSQMTDGSFYFPAPIPQMPMQAHFPMTDGSFYYPAAPVPQMPAQAQSPMADGSFYYPAAPVQQMPGGYGIQPQYFEQQMFYHQYYGQHYGQTGYPQYAQAQYPQQQQQQQQMMMGQPPMPQMMMGPPPRPPPPYHRPENPYNGRREQ